jgi:hypothetical protein
MAGDYPIENLASAANKYSAERISSLPAGSSLNLPLTPQLVRRQALTDFRFAGCARNSSRKSKCRIAVELVVDGTLEG